MHDKVFPICLHLGTFSNLATQQPRGRSPTRLKLGLQLKESKSRANKIGAERLIVKLKR